MSARQTRISHQDSRASPEQNREGFPVYYTLREGVQKFEEEE